MHTELPFPRFRSGKVRDVYDLGDELLIVATDRISAFDCILPTGIPNKGRLLTQMSLHWFHTLAEAQPNHIIGTWDDMSGRFPDLNPEVTAHLSGRTVLVKKTEPLPIECVVRGYISGSLWKEYVRARDDVGPLSRVPLHGYKLPPDLTESDGLEEPIFTPATKAVTGHDVNISFDEAAGIVGADVAAAVRDRSIALYTAAAHHARDKGIIIADTKFEFGIRNGEVILIDEILTPDSSRFWDAAEFEPGRGQASFDKQSVRDYLETLDWDKTPPAPPLPLDVVQRTEQRYTEAYLRLTGANL